MRQLLWRGVTVLQVCGFGVVISRYESYTLVEVACVGVIAKI